MHEETAMSAETLDEEYVEAYPGPEETEEVFPGGPTWADVAEWKSKYGEVYHVVINGQDYIFRPLTRLEYKNIMRSRENDPYFREEKTCEVCVLWPKDFKGAVLASAPAGVPTILAEHIMERSGFTLEAAARPLDPTTFLNTQ